MVRSCATVQVLVMPVYHTVAEVARSQAHGQLFGQRYYIPWKTLLSSQKSKSKSIQIVLSLSFQRHVANITSAHQKVFKVDEIDDPSSNQKSFNSILICIEILQLHSNLLSSTKCMILENRCPLLKFVKPLGKLGHSKSKVLSLPL